MGNMVSMSICFSSPVYVQEMITYRQICNLCCGAFWSVQNDGGQYHELGKELPVCPNNERYWGVSGKPVCNFAITEVVVLKQCLSHGHFGIQAARSATDLWLKQTTCFERDDQTKHILNNNTKIALGFHMISF